MLMYGQIGLMGRSHQWTPRRLPQLAAWYDANHGGTVKNASGATAINEEGVQEWLDLSGHGNHLVNTNLSGEIITFRTNQIGGKPGVCWDTNGASMLAATPNLLPDQAGPFTMFMVVQLKNTTAQQAMFSYGGLGGTVQALAWQEAFSGHYDIQAHTLGGTQAASFSISGGTADTSTHIVTSTATPGGNVTLYVDGVQVAQGSATSVPGTVAYLALGFYRGDQAVDNHRSLTDGTPIGEVIFCSGALDNAARAQVESYLMNKWGIPNPDVASWKTAIATYGATPISGEEQALKKALRSVATFRNKIVYWLVPAGSAPAGNLLTVGTLPSYGCTVPLIHANGNVTAALAGTNGTSAYYSPALGIRWSYPDNLTANRLNVGGVLTGLTLSDCTVMMSHRTDRPVHALFTHFLSSGTPGVNIYFGAGGGSNYSFRTVGSDTGLDTGPLIDVPYPPYSGVAIGRAGVGVNNYDEFRLYPLGATSPTIYTQTTAHTTAALSTAMTNGGCQILQGVGDGDNEFLLRGFGVAHGLTEAEADAWWQAQITLDKFYGRF